MTIEDIYYKKSGELKKAAHDAKRHITSRAGRWGGDAKLVEYTPLLTYWATILSEVERRRLTDMIRKIAAI